VRASEDDVGVGAEDQAVQFDVRGPASLSAEVSCCCCAVTAKLVDKRRELVLERDDALPTGPAAFGDR
jgi:hypothetical protein